MTMRAGERAIVAAVLCCAAANAAVYHAYPADNENTFCACVQKLSKPGDECRLHAGRYAIPKERCEAPALRGTADAPIVIAAAGDGPVVLDGTVALDGEWTAAAGGRAFKTKAPGNADVLQLLTGEGGMKVLARHPNAGWKDKGVFMAVQNWFRSSKPGVHNLTTGEGVLRDTGACRHPSDCCARCNGNDLAKSGINATGALAVVNLWSCDTGVQRVTEHSADDPGVLKYHATYKGLCDFYRGGDGRYYLEGKADFLDTDEEWWFDRERREVWVKDAPRHGDAPLRARVADYALVVGAASYLTVANVSLYGATMNIAGDVHDVALRSVAFNFSGVSYRALGDGDTPPAILSLFRPPQLESKGTPANFVMDDVVVRYSDGPALLHSGSNSVFTDSAFEWNDFTTVGSSWPVGVAPHGKAARACTMRTTGKNLLFRRLSFANNGAAQALSAGPNTTVELCDFAAQLQIQDDGSFVEGGMGTDKVNSTNYRNNWSHDTGKSGLRWDGYYPGTLGGVMEGNVAWNTSAMVCKGDNHWVSRNTVFDGSTIGVGHAQHDRPLAQDASSPLNDLTQPSFSVGAGTTHYDPRANRRSVFVANLIDAVGFQGAQCPHPPCTPPGTWTGNLIGTDAPWDARAELRAPFHHDFRPCPGSAAAKMSAGAYNADDDVVYWVPGRREQTAASGPLPPHESADVRVNTDLIFRPSVRDAAHREVYLGVAGAALTSIARLHGAAANVASLPAALQPHTAYQWRVDTTFPDGAVVPSPTWAFTTGAAAACHVKPAPPPKPHGQCRTCAACKKQYCPGLSGKGAACEKCVMANPGLGPQHGNCYHAGTRHSFIESYCY